MGSERARERERDKREEKESGREGERLHSFWGLWIPQVSDLHDSRAKPVLLFPDADHPHMSRPALFCDPRTSYTKSIFPESSAIGFLLGCRAGCCPGSAAPAHRCFDWQARRKRLVTLRNI